MPPEEERTRTTAAKTAQRAALTTHDPTCIDDVRAVLTEYTDATGQRFTSDDFSPIVDAFLTKVDIEAYWAGHGVAFCKHCETYLCGSCADGNAQIQHKPGCPRLNVQH